MSSRIYVKVKCLGLVDYYKTDLDGEYGGYGANITNKLRVKYALENDIDTEDIDVSFVSSVPRRVKMGEVYAGEIKDPA